MKRRQKVCVLLSVVLFLFHVVRNAPGVLILFMHDVYGESASVMAKATFISSFYRGYVLTQLPGAFVAHRSGGKMVLLYSIMGCGLTMLIAPLVATGPALSACMAIVGICQGPLLPAKAELLARWVPPNEVAEMLVEDLDMVEDGDPLHVERRLREKWNPQPHYVRGDAARSPAAPWRNVPQHEQLQSTTIIEEADEADEIEEYDVEDMCSRSRSGSDDANREP